MLIRPLGGIKDDRFVGSVAERSKSIAYCKLQTDY